MRQSKRPQTMRRYPDMRTRRKGEERDPHLFVLTAQMGLCAVAVLLGVAARDAQPSFLPALAEGYRTLITAERVELKLPEISYDYGQLRDTAADAAGEWITGLLGRAQEVSAQPPQDGVGGWMGVPEAGTRLPPQSCAYEPISVSAAVDPPAGGRVTSRYGYRVHPLNDSDDFHRGVDIAAAAGSPIRAALPGKVSEVGFSQIYGNYITLDHGNGLATTYCHCAEIIAQEGTNLRRGELVATVGSTGLSTGPHCHFEVQMNGTYYDPAWVLDGMRENAVSTVRDKI